MVDAFSFSQRRGCGASNRGKHPMCVSAREAGTSRPGVLRHCVWVGMTASVALALSACGGGGGGGDGGGGQQQQQNVAPTVQAGANQTITLPTNSVQLQGS